MDPRSWRIRVAGAASAVLALVACTSAPPPAPSRSAVLPSPSSAGAGTAGPAVLATGSDAWCATGAGQRRLAETLGAELLSVGYEDLRAVVVLAGGRTAFEWYRDAGPADHHDIGAITTTVVAALVGIAIGEGRIAGTSATLGELLPDRAEEMSARVASVTLEQLLTMTAGFAGAEPPPDAADRVEAVLAAAPFPPGHFLDSRSAAHLLSAILVQATGMPVLQYARSRLFAPLGISLAGPGGGWDRDAQGIQLGGGGLRLRALDLARFGQLHLQAGRWRGHQVLSADWVRAATAPRVDPGRGGFGYQWWIDPGTVGPGTWVARGSGGQRLIVAPDNRLVAVFLADPAEDPPTPIDALVDLAFSTVIATACVP